jgi:hypothetical protein
VGLRSVQPLTADPERTPTPNMTIRNPLGFKRVSAAPGVANLILLPFFLVGLALSWNNWRIWRMARELATFGSNVHPERKAVAGSVTRAQLVQSPLGDTVVGWAGQIGYLSKNKNRTEFYPICTRADLSQLSLTSYDAVWTVDFTLPGLPVNEAASSEALGDLPVVGFADLQSAPINAVVPPLANQLCVGMPAAPAPLVYREVGLQPEAHAEVLACADGERLVRCSDSRGYQFTNGSLRGMRSAKTSSSAYFWIFGSFWNLVLFGILGAVFKSGILRGRANVQERLGAE